MDSAEEEKPGAICSDYLIDLEPKEPSSGPATTLQS